MRAQWHAGKRSAAAMTAPWKPAQTQPPSHPTFERWIGEAVQAGKLKGIRASIFVNAAVPSLSWVLEQNCILNNFGDVMTCTGPMAPGLQVPAALPVADWRDNRYAHPNTHYAVRARPPFSAQVRVQRSCMVRSMTSITQARPAKITKPQA
jgi:hypothetical protein